MTTDNLGQQALNKAAEIGLSSQLDEVDKLEVDVQTDPFKLVQGQVDKVTVEGEGLVMQKDLRMDELEMQMNNIAINPLSAAFGKIELTKPTDASVRAVLIQEDINRAFNSEFVGTMLKDQKLHVNGQLMTVDTQQVDFKLPGDGKVALSANVLLRETGETKLVSFTAMPSASADGQSISLKQVQYAEGEEISPELTEALLNKASEILNLRNFDLEGMTLRIQKLDVEAGKITLFADAYVEKIPAA
ncbi:DUF2993 domain-containing protein [Microcoleus sp. FACHB-831]|uniref:LmeA family phospholipid-binding protein n=1 Tax=Microcoleus sp. FACHB-831 TaxID=2692827 RepID=UPI0016826C74|nr:LmeA family phospholipid-binding protein [Microcoleus sp. FACHB-831]MBD1923290.1 DUF2993 domain-containing protein [Microcoleus sp. FACHB-831]